MGSQTKVMTSSWKTSQTKVMTSSWKTSRTMFRTWLNFGGGKPRQMLIAVGKQNKHSFFGDHSLGCGWLQVVPLQQVGCGAYLCIFVLLIRTGFIPLFFHCLCIGCACE